MGDFVAWFVARMSGNFTAIGLRFYEKMFLKSISSNKHYATACKQIWRIEIFIFLCGIWSCRLQNGRRISLHLAAITRAGSTDCLHARLAF